MKDYSQVVEGIKQEIPNLGEYFGDKFVGILVECYDVVDAETLMHAINKYFGIELRRCSICGSLFSDGYCYDSGTKYYCCNECLHTEWTQESWERECNDNDNSYWSEWI